MKFASAGAAALAVVLVALFLLLRGGGEGPSFADAATRLVPADALVYVHLSTDREREGTEDAEKLARGFAGFDGAVSGLVGRLSAPQCGIAAADVEGKEAALALLDAGEGQAGSLVLVDTGKDQSKTKPKTCGTVQVEGIGTFLAVGQPQSLERARNLPKGRGRSLAQNPLYRRQTAQLGAGRVLDGWVTAKGVRRLLAPQAGLLGAAGTLLDQPGLRATAFAVTADGKDARLSVRSALTGTTGPAGALTGELARAVPKDAIAYLGLPRLSSGTTRLLGATGATAGLGQLAPLLARARTDLAKQVGPQLDRDVLALFQKEVALAITPGNPAPTLTLVAQADDPAATAATLRRLQAPLAKVLGNGGAAWKRVGGSFQLVPAEGIEVAYGVFANKLVISTRLAGVEAVRRAGDGLARDEDYRAVAQGAEEERPSSLVFLDFSQLLRLGEQTGLDDSKAYLAVKKDLQRVRAVGARSSTRGRQSTSEILLSIP